MWRVTHGEAIEVMRGMPACSVAAVVTDPPYSSGGQFRGDRASGLGNRKYLTDTADDYPAFEGDTRDQRSFGMWCERWMGAAWTVTAPGGYLLCTIDWRQLASVVDAVQIAGWVLRGIMPWIKPSARPQLGRFTNQAEYVVWASRGALAPAGPGSPTHPGYHIGQAPRDRQHPADMIRWLIRACPPGDILDPFAGSGTTLVAALAEGRSAIGIELSAEYAAIATDRCRAQDGGRDRFEAPEQGGLFAPRVG